MMRPARGSGGAALVTALVVVALASSAAVALSVRGADEIERTRLLLRAEQARQYAAGVEAWAQGVIAGTAAEALPALGERSLGVRRVAGGEVQGYLRDEQGGLNLNQLLDAEGMPDEVELAALRRLLDDLGEDPRLLDALVDWLDPDSARRSAVGAEDAWYLARQPPYRAANAPLATLGELTLVRGFDQRLVRRLGPHVTVLPARVPVNVNTATPQVLAALADGLDARRVRRIVDARGAGGFADLDQFLAVAGVGEVVLDRERVTVTSSFFVVEARAVVDGVEVAQRSLLMRLGDGVVRVLRREGVAGNG